MGVPAVHIMVMIQPTYLSSWGLSCSRALGLSDGPTHYPCEGGLTSSQELQIGGHEKLRTEWATDYYYPEKGDTFFYYLLILTQIFDGSTACIYTPLPCMRGYLNYIHIHIFIYILSGDCPASPTWHMDTYNSRARTERARECVRPSSLLCMLSSRRCTPGGWGRTYRVAQVLAAYGVCCVLVQ